MARNLLFPTSCNAFFSFPDILNTNFSNPFLSNTTKVQFPRPISALFPHRDSGREKCRLTQGFVPADETLVPVCRPNRIGHKSKDPTSLKLRGTSHTAITIKDHLGSTKSTLALYTFDLASALLVKASDTDPYGITTRDLSTSPANGEPHRFTGQEREDDLGLYTYGARFYMPEIGRFIQVDPAREFANPYSYVGNNPVGFVDPSGLDSWVFFYDIHFGDQANAEADRLRETYNTGVHLIPVGSLEDFTAGYTQMLADEDIQEISLFFHSNARELLFDRPGEHGTETWEALLTTTEGVQGLDRAAATEMVENLPHYSGGGPIQINLYSCNGATMDHTARGLSLAYQLAAHFNTIVYGWEGSIKFDSNGAPIKSREQHGFRGEFGRNPMGRIGFFVDPTTGEARGFIYGWKNESVRRFRVNPWMRRNVAE